MTVTVSNFKPALIIFALVLALPAAGDGAPEANDPPPHPAPLDEVEVLEYKGEDLSPVNGSFRENSIAGPQYIDVKDYRLTVAGLVDTELALTYDQVLQNDAYEKVVTLNCVEGWSATILWEGVLVRDLLDAANVDRSSAVVIFHAEDGYTTAHPLSLFYDKDIIMAYKMNGLTMPYERGFPFQLVAENKWGYKWIKWIVKMEVSNDADYKGFWEGYGYDNDGDLTGSFYQ